MNKTYDLLVNRYPTNPTDEPSDPSNTSTHFIYRNSDKDCFTMEWILDRGSGKFCGGTIPIHKFRTMLYSGWTWDHVVTEREYEINGHKIILVRYTLNPDDGSVTALYYFEDNDNIIEFVMDHDNLTEWPRYDKQYDYFDSNVRFMYNVMRQTCNTAETCHDESFDPKVFFNLKWFGSKMYRWKREVIKGLVNTYEIYRGELTDDVGRDKLV